MKNPLSSSCKKILSIFLTTILLLSTTINPVHAQDPKVSIIIPVYNTSENLLRDCLESAKNQTLKDIEIICVDDGSTNESGKILDEYAKNDPRFKVVHQENGGVCIARDNGIDLAKGEYIQFLDQNDQINPIMSEKCYNKAKEFDADIVKCGSNAFSISDCVYESPVFNPPIMSNRFAIMVWDGLYKTKFLKNNDLRFKDLRYGADDVVFNYMCLAKASKIVCFSQKLCQHTMKAYLNLNASQKLNNCVYDINLLYKNWKNNGYFYNNSAKVGFLVLFTKLCDMLFDGNPSIEKSAGYKTLIGAIGPELLKDEVINLLPLEKRIHLKAIIQCAS